MSKYLRSKPLAACSFLSAVGVLAALAVAAPEGAAAAGEKEYSASFQAECVVGPGVFNLKPAKKVTVTIASMGPTEVTPGEEGTFHGAHSTITSPVEFTEDFANFGATEVKGKATNFVLEGSGAEPAKLNIAKPAEYPEGLPFIAPVEKGKEEVFDIPSKTLGEKGLTFSFGPEKVTATSGILKAFVSAAPGFTETAVGEYAATGEGLVTVVEGLKAGTRVIGPITVACNAPSGVVAAEIPVNPGTGLTAGKPQLYTNAHQDSTTPVEQVAHGELLLKSGAISGGELECGWIDFESGWNESERAHGQILTWVGSGHVSNGTHTELSQKCRGLGGSAWVVDESPVEGGKRGAITTPWNMIGLCGEREEERTALIQIGYPTGEEPPVRACQSAAAEKTEIAAEHTNHLHCSKIEEGKGLREPEGCVDITIVDPAAGLEVRDGGSFRPRWTNGAGNGLDASTWSFEGEVSGALSCESTGCTSPLTFSGQGKVVGFEAQQLITIK
jgi:hypothetical protein